MRRIREPQGKVLASFLVLFFSVSLPAAAWLYKELFMESITLPPPAPDPKGAFPPSAPTCRFGPLSFSLPNEILLDGRLPNGKNAKKAKRHLEKALDALYKDVKFFCFVDSSEPLKIFLIPPTVAFDKGSMGIFSVKENQIGIVYKSHFDSHAYCKVLRNEFYSREISQININKGISRDHPYIALPFIDEKAKIDKTLYKTFKAGIDELKSNVDYYKASLKKPAQQQSKEEKTKLALLQDQAKEYVPLQFTMSEKELTDSVSLGISTPIDEKGYFHPTQKLFNLGLTATSGKKTRKGYIYQHSVQYNNDELSRTQALIGDLFQQIISINSPDGPYAQQSAYKRETELGSFIAQLPTPLLEFIAPAFYAYMRDFLTQDTFDQTQMTATFSNF